VIDSTTYFHHLHFSDQPNCGPRHSRAQGSLETYVVYTRYSNAMMHAGSPTAFKPQPTPNSKHNPIWSWSTLPSLCSFSQASLSL